MGRRHLEVTAATATSLASLFLSVSSVLAVVKNAASVAAATPGFTTGSTEDTEKSLFRACSAQWPCRRPLAQPTRKISVFSVCFVAQQHADPGTRFRM